MPASTASSFEEQGNECRMAEEWLFTQDGGKYISFPGLVVNEMSTFPYGRQA